MAAVVVADAVLHARDRLQFSFHRHAQAVRGSHQLPGLGQVLFVAQRRGVEEHRVPTGLHALVDDRFDPGSGPGAVWRGPEPRAAISRNMSLNQPRAHLPDRLQRDLHDHGRTGFGRGREHRFHRGVVEDVEGPHAVTLRECVFEDFLHGHDGHGLVSASLDTRLMPIEPDTLTDRVGQWSQLGILAQSLAMPASIGPTVLCSCPQSVNRRTNQHIVITKKC